MFIMSHFLELGGSTFFWSSVRGGQTLFYLTVRGGRRKSWKYVPRSYSRLSKVSLLPPLKILEKKIMKTKSFPNFEILRKTVINRDSIERVDFSNIASQFKSSKPSNTDKVKTFKQSKKRERTRAITVSKLKLFFVLFGFIFF